MSDVVSGDDTREPMHPWCQKFVPKKDNHRGWGACSSIAGLQVEVHYGIPYNICAQHRDASALRDKPETAAAVNEKRRRVRVRSLIAEARNQLNKDKPC